MAEESGQTVVAALLEHILPLDSGLRDRLKQGIDVLDVGCGSGRAMNLLAGTFPASRFTGFDLCPDAVELARAEASRRGTKNIRFEAKDVAKLNGAREFDLITAFDVIHDQADPKGVLRGINQALKPDGILLLKLPNMSNPFSIDSRYRDFTHECGFTEESIYQVLYMAGFRNISINPSQEPGKSLISVLRRTLTSMLHAVLRKLFWHQGITAPKILSCRLVVSAKKGEIP